MRSETKSPSRSHERATLMLHGRGPRELSLSLIDVQEREDKIAKCNKRIKAITGQIWKQLEMVDILICSRIPSWELRGMAILDRITEQAEEIQILIHAIKAFEEFALWPAPACASQSPAQTATHTAP